MNPPQRDTPVLLPFLNGVYVAVDALPRTAVVVDGPYCVFSKAEMQHMHNLRSSLLPPWGYFRVVHTGQDSIVEEVAGLALDRFAKVEGVLRDVVSRPEFDLVLATSFDFHQLIAFPLADVAAKVASDAAKPVLHVASASLDGIWLDGYAATCETLARSLPLEARPEPGTVAVVGYLFDRDEPDHQGNLREIERLLGLLDLRVQTVWLSGRDIGGLAAAARAETIVSLPYARSAARLLAERLATPLVETEIPLGLDGTCAFLRRIAQATGRESLAETLAEAETARVVSATHQHIQRFLAGRPVRLPSNDPHLHAGLASFCEECGLQVSPTDEQESGVYIGPAIGAPKRRSAIVSLGYPAYDYHPLGEAPFLGFAGFRCLVDRIAAAVLDTERRQQFEATA